MFDEKKLDVVNEWVQHLNIFYIVQIVWIVNKIEYVGEGGQLWLNHHTLATPSAGRGFGSDLAILGANPRREWCRPERPQSHAGAAEGGPLGMGGASRAVLSIAASWCSFASSSLSKSTLPLPLSTSSPCVAAMSAPSGANTAPSSSLRGWWSP